MNKRKLTRMGVVLLTITVLSACSNTQGARPEDTPVNEAPSVQQPKENPPVVIPDQFYQLPNEIILPPDGEWDLSIEGAQYASSDPRILNINSEGKLHVGADAITGEQASITVMYADQKKVINIKVKYDPSDTIIDLDGVATVTNPADLLVLVNKERSLPADYVPEGLTPPDIPFYFSENIEKRWLRPVAAKAIEEMFAAAKQDGIKLIGASAYRSYTTQKTLFSKNVTRMGEDEAARLSARPGRSEHQTGLCIDVYHSQITNGLEESFADTPEGQWVADHAYEFGFIVRYPKGKEEITGYSYEPWHLRYVGTSVAQEIYEKGITLEEYFQEDSAYTTK